MALGLDVASTEAVELLPYERVLHELVTTLSPLNRDAFERRLDVAAEHYVTNQVRQKIFSAINQLSSHGRGPEAVIACPSGKFHEVGAQAVAYVCTSRGDRIYYLYASMPIADLLKFCVKCDRNCPVSVVTPPGDIVALTKALGDLAHPKRTILLGGASAHLIELPSGRPGLAHMHDLADLQTYLTAPEANVPVHSR